MTTTDELQLRPFLSGIADAIREVEESEEDINAQEFVERIKALSGGTEISIIEYAPTSNVRLFGSPSKTWEHYLSNPPNLIMMFTDLPSIPTATNAPNQLWWLFAINLDMSFPMNVVGGNGAGNSNPNYASIENTWEINETSITTKSIAVGSKDTLKPERVYYIICATI